MHLTRCFIIRLFTSRYAGRDPLPSQRTISNLPNFTSKNTLQYFHENRSIFNGFSIHAPVV
jgi:hypothetical protein